MTKPPDDPRQLARSVTTDAFEVLVDVMNHPEATMANRLAAALALWERGWGKPSTLEGTPADERRVSELTTAELYERASATVAAMQATLADTRAAIARTAAILDQAARGSGGEGADKAEPADIRELDRDPGSTDAP